MEKRNFKTVKSYDSTHGRERSPRTLDGKGRINEKMLMNYEGLYNKVLARKMGMPSPMNTEEQRLKSQTAHLLFEFEQKRAPQLSARSTSPFLVANNFNFDVTDILIELKQQRDQRLIKERYRQMSYKHIEDIIFEDEKLKNLGQLEKQIAKEVLLEKVGEKKYPLKKRRTLHSIDENDERQRNQSLWKILRENTEKGTVAKVA